MKHQEILEIIKVAANPQEGQQKVLETFVEKLNNDNNYLAMTIAAYVRHTIEDFHHEHLSDEQMKELNPLIRNAIYTFLEDWTNGNVSKIFGKRMLNCPEYWEDCEYIDD